MSDPLSKRAPFVFPDSDKIFDEYCKNTRSKKVELLPKQKTAFREYSFHQGSNGKQEDAPFRYINQYVRDIIEGKKSRVDNKYRKLAITMNDTLSKKRYLVKGIPLYRGIRNVPSKLTSASVGDVIEVDQFVSMTSNPHVANSFSDSNGAMLIIKNLRGIPLNNNAESEYLAQPGSHFRIDKVYTQDWISSRRLEHTNVTVYELTMLNKFTSLPELNNTFTRIVKESFTLWQKVITFCNFLFCTLFLLTLVKLSIYAPPLLKEDIKYIPESYKLVSQLDFFNKSFGLIFGPMGLLNSLLCISLLLMATMGLILFSFTDDKLNKSIWLKTIVTTFTIGGILVTIFSVRAI